MKKITPNPPETDTSSETETLDITQLSEAIQRRVTARLRDPKQPDPVSHIFTILPDVDSPTLLAHASETLASLNVMSTDLADQLEGSHRNVALAIQQLAVLAEMLINRALDNLDSPESKVKPVCH
ncbi:MULTISPECIES: DUF6124 family protein [unclassified Pseudomonas]|jgi:hypothetical protein|uniref:DUF6124 family protein n=1 Tax=unclassified Pseudomonas TaxID=196821 RepID=UPI001913CA36|nr:MULTISPECIES: DUF6124 family protein [unclassified Pseudomonas]MBK5549083.1 hypothetical protein [Pseudomonas sp. TH03]MEB0223059.1 DUF6124 family protein [Pseudomonas sp. 5S1]MEB0297588.1 DUF6124 family protein [Pseudomonas sp. 10S4]WPX20655.1 DUF6124 family protein [Pseudomonas sp. 10S4]